MAATFRDLIARNKRNSRILVVLFCLFVAVVAMVLSIAIVSYLDPERLGGIDIREALAVGAVAAGVALLASFWGYYGGDKMVLAVSRARPITHADDPELFNVVEEIAIAAGIPMPAVYVIDDAAPNAFATGRDPEHAALAVTSGLRQKLTRDELQGVIAHEVSHIRNFDTQLMLLLAVLIGTLVMLADVLWRMVLWGPARGGGRRRERGDGQGGGLLQLVLLVLAVVLAIVAPILAQIIQLAVSRQREYLADASGVELTRYPLGLARALRKIDADPEELEGAPRGTAHLYISNPIAKFKTRGGSMFASHPPTKERIARLEQLAGG